MKSLYPMAKSIGMVIMLGLLFFILQGCTKPFVSVVVEVDGCCKNGDCTDRDGVAGCPNPPGIGSPGFPAGTYDNIQCSTGVVCGSMEGNTCARGRKCDTQHTSGSTTNCTCACVRNPT